MTDVIAIAKARMRELMRDGETLNLLSKTGREYRFSAETIWYDAIDHALKHGLSDAAASKDEAMAGHLVLKAREATIEKITENEVAEWLAHQAQNQEDAE